MCFKSTQFIGLNNVAEIEKETVVVVNRAVNSHLDTHCGLQLCGLMVSYLRQKRNKLMRKLEHRSFQENCRAPLNVVAVQLIERASQLF